MTSCLFIFVSIRSLHRLLSGLMSTSWIILWVSLEEIG